MSYDRRTLPKEKRTIPLRGSDTHKGKWFKCWNCGFPCYTEREKLDKNGTYDGVGYTVVSVADVSSPTIGDKNWHLLSMNTIRNDFLLVAPDANGDPIYSECSHRQLVTQFCPSCGCPRWQ